MENTNHVSTKDWIITILIAAIPVVNIIMLFVWGFGGNTNPNKANWAKAALIWLAIAIVLNIIGFVTFGSLAFLGLGSSS